jgi:DMSO/TMAO reductase YedYZ molybdopterin-dependent catalytic subunit
MSRGPMNRRHWLLAALASVGAGVISACDSVTRAPSTLKRLIVAEKWAMRTHRFFRGDALAPEFSAADISKDFRANGTIQPVDLGYMMLQDTGFADWRLKVSGLVEMPLELTMAELRVMPSRTQITRHDCVEGWSSIGKWKGARLSAILERAKLKPSAKYIVFWCMDTLDPSATDNSQGRYYESIDLHEALHEQTILAYDMNDAALPVKHGAPLRLRVERMLGYKHAKYIESIQVVDTLDGLALGRGGFWPDRGYEWYAGI